MKRLYIIFGFLCLVAPLHGMEEKITIKAAAIAPTTVASPIKLQFSDTAEGEIGTTISLAAANTSGLLKGMLEDIGPTDSPIPLPTITKAVWQSSIAPVLTILSENIGDKEKVSKIKAFLNKEVQSRSTQTIIQFYEDTINAADYLDIPDLVTIATKQLTSLLKTSWEAFLNHPDLFNEKINKLNPPIADTIKEKLAPLSPGKPLLQSTLQDPIDHTSSDSLAFSANGTTLFSGSGQNIKLWDVIDRKNPRLTSTTIDTNSGYSFVLLPNRQGTILYSGSTLRKIQLWDIANLKTPHPIHTIQLTKHISSLVLSHDGSILISGSSYGFIDLWDLTDRQKPRLIGTITRSADRHLNHVNALVLSTDGTTLISGSLDRSIKLWDITDGQNPQFMGSVDHLPNGIVSLVLASDGTTLISESLNHSITLWDISNKHHLRPIHTIDQSKNKHPSSGLPSLAVNPEGTLLISWSGDGIIKLWDITDREHPRIIDQMDRSIMGELLSLALSPNGKTIAIGYASGTIELWDIGASLADLDLLQTLCIYSVGRYYEKYRTRFTLESDGLLRMWYDAMPNLLREQLDSKIKSD